MAISVSQSSLLLGTVNHQPVELGPAAYQLSLEQARSIAIALGSRETETSMENYWSLETRLRQWQQIADHVGIEHLRSARIVEIGSGMGLFTLTGRLLGFDVVGIDSASDRYNTRMRIASYLLTDHGLDSAFIQSPSERLPLADQSVDIVATFQTLEHVVDVARSLGEISRVLKPGGIVFAQLPNYRSLHEAHYGTFFPLGLGKAWKRRYLRLIGKPTAFLEHLQWLTPEVLRGGLNTAGFANVRVTPTGQPSYSEQRLPGEGAMLPFRWRRGRYEYRAARILARLADRFGLDHELYPQIEAWATRAEARS